MLPAKPGGRQPSLPFFDHPDNLFVGGLRGHIRGHVKTGKGQKRDLVSPEKAGAAKMDVNLTRLHPDSHLSAFTGAPDPVSVPLFEALGHIMAQNATIYKVELSVSDMDRDYYETHKLTIAKHPSETDERLMVRIVAFALNAHENLEMTKGISTPDEPDIWQKSLSGELDVWVALGLPSEKVIRQSCSKAHKVMVYPYGGRVAEMWWDKIKASIARFDNLQVTCFTEKDTAKLAKLANRAMKLQINIQDGEVMVSVGDSIVYVTPLKWRSAA